MYWDYYGRWGMGFGWILVIAFWVLIILGIVLFIKTIVRGDRNPGGHESAIEILRKRYARGEISREEFEKMKDDIKRS